MQADELADALKRRTAVVALPAARLDGRAAIGGLDAALPVAIRGRGAVAVPQPRAITGRRDGRGDSGDWALDVAVPDPPRFWEGGFKPRLLIGILDDDRPRVSRIQVVAATR